MVGCDTRQDTLSKTFQALINVGWLGKRFAKIMGRLVSPEGEIIPPQAEKAEDKDDR